MANAGAQAITMGNKIGFAPGQLDMASEQLGMNEEQLDAFRAKKLDFGTKTLEGRQMALMQSGKRDAVKGDINDIRARRAQRRQNRRS